jgi:hypothetical protein
MIDLLDNRRNASNMNARSLDNLGHAAAAADNFCCNVARLCGIDVPSEESDETAMKPFFHRVAPLRHSDSVR